MAAGVVRHIPPGVRTRLRRMVNRLGIDVTANPFHRRLTGMCQLLGVRTVIDVGANAGQYAMMLRGSGFRGRIVSCEPLAQPYGELARRADSDALWQTERLALGARAGTVAVHVAANSYSSSVLPMLAAHLDAAPESHYVGTEQAAMSTVDSLVVGHGIDPAATLLKLDVQGYESTVLEGAAATLPRLLAVQTELSITPLYDGQQLMGELVQTLVAHGFEPWMYEPGFCDPRTGRMLQCDGVFVRADAIPTP